MNFFFEISFRLIYAKNKKCTKLLCTSDCKTTKKNIPKWHQLKIDNKMLQGPKVRKF